MTSSSPDRSASRMANSDVWEIGNWRSGELRLNVIARDGFMVTQVCAHVSEYNASKVPDGEGCTFLSARNPRIPKAASTP